MAQALLAEDSEEAALKLSGDALLGAVLEAKREHYGPAAPVEVPAYGPPPPAPAPGGERHAAGAAAGAPGAPPEGAPEEQLQDLTQRLSRYGASKVRPRPRTPPHPPHPPTPRWPSSSPRPARARAGGGCPPPPRRHDGRRSLRRLGR